MIVNTINMILSVYVVLEVIAASIKMDRGGKPLQFLKYAAASAMAIYGFYKAFNGDSDYFYTLCLISVAFFLLPIMIHRITGKYDNRIGDKR